MAVSMRDLDPAFQGAGQKAGIEVWRIESFRPVLAPKSSHGKFFTGDSYIVLKTTALKTGALRHDIHYWLGKDTSQDEAGTAAVKTVELDAALGGHAVQYREIQGNETEKFLSYFKPCIIPQEGRVASGFNHVEAEEHKTCLFACRGKHVVHVKEVPVARTYLNHDDIFILDTKSKIFQFNGSNAIIQERAKALEVVQYIKDTYHDGKCEVATVEDGRLMADAESGEFWGFFGGFAPLPRKTVCDEEKTNHSDIAKLFCVEKGQANQVKGDELKQEMFDSYHCYILDCGFEVFVWMGRNTSLDNRKSASRAAEEMIRLSERSKSQIIRVIEGFETVAFRSKFESWTQKTNSTLSNNGRGRVAALLQRQGVNVSGLLKASPPKEEPQAHIDCRGNLQVWRVDGQEKILLEAADQSKFYSGDCYIFHYSYPGEYKEEVLIGTWCGAQSVEEERSSAVYMAIKMVEAMKFVPAQARIYQGKEPIQFFVIMQSFIVFKGGLSNGYKKHIAEKEIQDDTYNENGLALFRIQGFGPENMQAIQVDPVASSLNSSYWYILHNGSSVFTWSGNLAASFDQELVERQLDVIKPNLQTRAQREGSESEQFWELLGGKSDYPSQKPTSEPENDPHLFACAFTKGNLKVTEIYNFTQDDLMTEDIFVIDCHSEIFVWVGQEVQPYNKLQALFIGEKFIEQDFLLENLSNEAPIYVIMEGNEPLFFTRFFASWDSSKAYLHGNSFERKLKIVKNGSTPVVNKPRRRSPASYGGRTSVPEKSHQRSKSMSFSPERVRVRGRSPAFNALAAAFENPSARNLSTPPSLMRKTYPRSLTPPDAAKLAPKSSAIALPSAIFEQVKPQPREPLIPSSIKVSRKTAKSPFPKSNIKDNVIEKQNSMSIQIASLTIHEDTKEGVEDEESFPIYPYERLKTTSMDPIADIDVTRRETYLSAKEFKEKFGMSKEAFYELPKWKQNKFKMAAELF
ncbi:unnamed protein product [Arabis nemorensis]|uniref:HP domain-containing protein n=1 Tax=Arabis nemorensis TaxID=586526 RepID=A0A565BD78_9BRAS|nr:unnamed protein product [Arabis nemorensis]